MGATIADLQKQYQRSRSTVRRLLRDARQSSELIEHARGMVLERLVPLALVVYHPRAQPRRWGTNDRLRARSQPALRAPTWKFAEFTKECS